MYIFGEGVTGAFGSAIRSDTPDRHCGAAGPDRRPRPRIPPSIISKCGRQNCHLLYPIPRLLRGGKQAHPTSTLATRVPRLQVPKPNVLPKLPPLPHHNRGSIELLLERGAPSSGSSHHACDWIHQQPVPVCYPVALLLLLIHYRPAIQTVGQPGCSWPASAREVVKQSSSKSTGRFCGGLRARPMRWVLHCRWSLGG